MSDEYDDMSTDDLFTGEELREMEQADEARLDAEDDARNAADAASEHDDGEPWEGYADGEER
ncbi:hypothetical protein QMZ92_13220 [Streptomyces sp. HNM0645]|uniref:hypothetical protein n=1 Tax=Streptomyces sp. HNM0645 TaxID=2782343 RepID=UPI0024B6B87D|nr:hypothetical protein [Streptomyces sp. HNM0645]MDI9885328.1 hypothetical protein [Streptomyces sp. HNM0645]